MDVLGIIPARSGSTGVPGKNVRVLGGKPLIVHTIEAASASAIGRVVVSTDSEDYARIARAAGAEVPFIRLAGLAANETPAISVVAHCLEALQAAGHAEPDAVFYLQPTSPFRTAQEIDAAIALLSAGVDSVASVKPVTKHPYYMFTPDASGLLTPLIDVSPRPERRQDLPEIYALNDSIMLSRIGWIRRAIRENGLIVNLDNFAPLPVEGRAALDINSEEDFALAEFLASRTPTPV
jgi:CMP-N,N'-diacetyllegionaminic acid synthase